MKVGRARKGGLSKKSEVDLERRRQVKKRRNDASNEKREAERIRRGEGKNAQFGIPLYQGNNERRNPSWLNGCIYFGPSRWFVRTKNRSID